MQFLVVIILYLYYQNEVSNKKEAIFLGMQNYSLTLKGDRFSLDIVTKNEAMKSFVLYEEQELYAYFPILDLKDTLLKVTLKASEFHKIIEGIYQKSLVYLGLSVIILVLLALLFSIYTLKPLRQSIRFLEEFLKDIIHDLNTPVTAILLNSRLLKKNYKRERVERIELSAKTIGSLHKNLETFLRKQPLDTAEVNLQKLLLERVEYFKSIFSNLSFIVETKVCIINSNEDALRRILDNLISNACKYNRPDGFVKVTLTENSFSVEDSGKGIKDTIKVFERFYKEGERGLGIGLHIVKKLSVDLGLVIKVDSSSEGSTFTLSW